MVGLSSGSADSTAACRARPIDRGDELVGVDAEVG